MEYIVTPEEMKCADEITIQEYGIKSSVLMERAALQTMEVLKQEAFDLSKVLVVCGIGNNGGDGLALSRLLIDCINRKRRESNERGQGTVRNFKGLRNRNF